MKKTEVAKDSEVADCFVELCGECNGTGDLFQKQLNCYYERLCYSHKQFALECKSNTPFEDALSQVGDPPRRSDNHICNKCGGTGYRPILSANVVHLIKYLNRYIDQAIQKAIAEQK